MDGHLASPSRGVLTPPRRPERPLVLFNLPPRLYLGSRAQRRPLSGLRSAAPPHRDRRVEVTTCSPPHSTGAGQVHRSPGVQGKQSASLIAGASEFGAAAPPSVAPHGLDRPRSGRPHHSSPRPPLHTPGLVRAALPSPPGIASRAQRPGNAVSSDGLRTQHLHQWPRGWARFAGLLVGPSRADELCARHLGLCSHAPGGRYTF
ncbi:hypothetical protein NDU88_004831 [Pleurodeles waltl]|uniref:Uncharacterized protein n=1 Tax=Pleurodeles waltl TaxID=8319 RepID=A0AAV7TVG3_PLEWA|nr:hypothetical protein NDU88_004831 [Pleurodeles waltl]